MNTNRVERIENEIASLTLHELMRFRRWYVDFDGHRWDQQFEEDVAAGRLDALADAALAEYHAGRTNER